MAKGFGPSAKTLQATKRQKAYFKVIQAILKCPSGRELKILGNHAHLIDAGLVEMMAMVATILVADKELTRAKFLMGWAVILTQELGLNNKFFSVDLTISSQENFLRQWDFIQEQTRFRLFFQLLDAISESHRNFQTVDQRIVREINLLLEANQDQLDECFVKVLRYHSSAILSEVPPKGQKGIAARLMVLSYCIHEFKKGNEANNLESAIAGYEIAVTVLTYEAFPEQWAACQKSLGNAYHRRFKGDRAENLERSIACCQNALKVLTHESFPMGWAEIKHNLAIAYGNRIRGDRLENEELAIAACRATMEVYTREAMPEAWAKIQNNLGIVYRYRICGDKAENLEQAIACYQNALLFRTREEFPELWAQTQTNLASAYCHRLHGDPVENVEKAIAVNLEALQVYTQDAFPADWAGVKTNLGNAYRALAQLNGERNENLEMAIAVFTPTAFPVDCRNAGEMLGNIVFVVANWQLAIEGYGMAIEAVETSRTWATSEFRRQEIVAGAIDVYAKMVQACINNKQLDKAFEYVERSRSKRLVDLMASNDLYSSAEIPAEIQEYLQDFEGLQQQIDKERGRNQPSSDIDNSKLDNSRASLAAYNQTIADLEAEKLLIWEQLRRLDPVLAGQIRVNPLKFVSIQQLIDKPTTAILSFYTTVTDTFIFVVRQNQITLQSCNDLGFEALHGWILQHWLGQYVEDKKSWQEQLNWMLNEIAQFLNLNDLIVWHLDGIDELIIIPHTGDLPCASFEGDKLATLYAIPDDRRLKGRHQATVNKYRELARTVQILHSSHHAQSRLDNPLESTLILGDGCITLGQLMTPGWRLPQLSDVFLSCCETGLGMIDITDDVLTFSTAFLSAGARSVISTLWAVDDLATALFSIFYYQEWQQGKNRPEAIRKAQVKLRMLTGDTLAASYKPQLKEVLKQKLKETDTLRKSSKAERDTCSSGSQVYRQLDEEYQKYDKIGQQIHQCLKNLDRICQESKPFSHPIYWAAFIGAGVR